MVEEMLAKARRSSTSSTSSVGPSPSSLRGTTPHGTLALEDGGFFGVKIEAKSDHRLGVFCIQKLMIGVSNVDLYPFEGKMMGKRSDKRQLV